MDHNKTFKFKCIHSPSLCNMTNSFVPYEEYVKVKRTFEAHDSKAIDRRKLFVSFRFTLYDNKDKIIHPLKEANENGNATDS